MTDRDSIDMVIMEIAKSNLKEFEICSDEAFLLRAEMERKFISI